MTTTRLGWFHLASGAGIGRILGFLSNLLLSRWLGPADLGLFNLVATTIQTSDTLSRCGADYALNFELGGDKDSVYSVRGVGLVRGIVQICTLTTIVICVFLFLWLWFAQGLFPVSLSTNKRGILIGLLLVMIASEGCSASAWEVLLASHRTAQLAMKQGLFFPLRLLCSAVGALFLGVLGAMAAWSAVAIVQCLWLRRILGHLWNPFKLMPIYKTSIRKLLSRGLPFYGANLLSSVIFYPLLLQVANGSGLADIGYLRVGQVLQQLFAFLPATLVPVLFLKLRGQSSFAEQVTLIEKPLRIVWLLMLEVLLFYCLLDHSLIVWLFGDGFVAALLPTRLLLITALFECLAQLFVQPMLATGQTWTYGIWQNASALFAALLGWIWIPASGLSAYLTVRLIYAIMPMVAFGIPVFYQLYQPRKLSALLIISMIVPILFLTQIFSASFYSSMTIAYPIASIILLIAQSDDILMLYRDIRSRA